MLDRLTFGAELPVAGLLETLQPVSGHLALSGMTTAHLGARSRTEAAM
jgi:hypothetical protein